MQLADGLVNFNSISAIALGFFTALFGAISVVVVQLAQIKAKTNEAKDVALDTKKEAEQARKNTANTSNGFASNVDTKLNRIIGKQDKLSDALQKHLEWHIEHPVQKG